MKTLRWGILGTGMIARKFAADLPHSTTGTLHAVASRTQSAADAFCREFGGRAIAGYEMLLADPEVDAIYLSLPNGMHRDWSIAALRAGKHVLCEKPMARNAAEAAEMFAAAEDSGKVLIEAFMYRTHPLIQRLIEFVRGGGIGELRLMRANFTFARPAGADDARYDPTQGGGSLMDVGCYCVNFARAVAGTEPVGVSSTAHLHPLGVDDYAAGTLTFPGAFLATFTCGMTVASDPVTHIAGSEGRIAIDSFWFGKNGFTVTRPDGTVERHESPVMLPLYALEADAFATTVSGKTPPWIAKEDTLGNMRVLDELRRAAGVP